MKNSDKKRVFVGLSGGVDSAVAAALIKKQGYDVAGAFMRFWKEGQGAENACCSVESEAAARNVAAKLAIPFYVFNFEREFKKAVVNYFLVELRSGRTPNPCVVCNPQIKFGLFLEKAKKLGADFVATGHYARLRREFSIFNFQFSKKSQNQKVNRAKLYQAKDRSKDQSYFLYRLNQEQLSRIIFPLGSYTKKEVYKLAKQWRLPHQAHQSFDVCFIDDYGKFLAKYLKMRPGKIVYVPSEKVLGTHAGLPLYTIGQRASVGGPGPFFVMKKDVKKNILYVSNKERDLYQQEARLEKVNWLAGRAPKFPFNCKVKIRYQAEAVGALIIKRGARIVVKFQKSQRAITPGQSAVFYGRGGEVLGGGIIKNGSRLIGKNRFL